MRFHLIRCAVPGRRPAGSPPREAVEDKRSTVSYEDTVIDSAVLAHVVLERPGGNTIPQLARALGFERSSVEDAVHGLIDSQLLRMDGARVLPYRSFGREKMDP